MTQSPFTPQLPLLGSESFLPNLIHYLQTHPELLDWQLDPSLLALIILCIVADEKGIIVDVLKTLDARGSITKVVDVLNGIFGSIFGLRTCHLHLDNASTPGSIEQDILRSSYSRRRGYKRGTSRSVGKNSVLEEPTSTPGAGHRLFDSPDSPHPAVSKISRGSSIASSSYVSARESPVGLELVDGVYSERATPFINQEGIPSQGLNSGKDGNGLGLGSASSQLHEENRELPQVIIVTGLEGVESPIQIKLAEIINRRKVEDQDLPGEFMVVWVRDEDESEKAPSWMLDLFTCSITLHPDDLDEPPTELRNTTLIPSDYLASLSSLIPYTHLHPPLQTHISNLLSTVSLHPRLKTTVTAKAITSFPIYVKAHMVLSSPFHLRPGWEERVQGRIGERSSENRHKQGMSETDARFGLGGGRGGVDLWGAMAGEEPDIRSLSFRSPMPMDLPTHQMDNQFNDSDEGSTLEGNKGEFTDDWYATPQNVSAVFSTVLRHRVKYREERKEVMWLVKGGAGGKVLPTEMSSKGDLSVQKKGTDLKENEEQLRVIMGGMVGKGNSMTGHEERKRRIDRRRRAEVDRIMEKILEVV